MRAENKEINMQIGKRLRTTKQCLITRFRENGGYTQEVFAETLDVNVEHYRKMVSGDC